MSNIIVLLIIAAIGWRLYKRLQRSLRRYAPRSSRYIPPKTKAYVFLRDCGVCQHCGREATVGEPLEYDHIKPWSWGGPSTADNLQLLCHRCNAYKSNRYVG